MRSSFRRSTLNSPSWPDSRGGARRHPSSDLAVDGKAAERPPDFLPARQEVEQMPPNSQYPLPDNPGVVQVRQLWQLRGIGEQSAWVLVTELFAWRRFRNRRAVGGITGMVGPPYRS